MEMPRCRRVAIQTNTSVELKDSIFMFCGIKQYMYIMFSNYVVYTRFLLKNTGGLLSCPGSTSLRL